MTKNRINIWENVIPGKICDKIIKSIPPGIYLLKVNNLNTRTECKLCLMLIIKTPQQCDAPVLGSLF